jgi:nitrogen fixation NifU-like protein
MSDSMYKEYILELYRSPLNKGVLDKPTCQATATNQSCGDTLTLQMKITNGTIADIAFSGSGCAISIASASLLTELLKTMTVDQAKKITQDQVVSQLQIPITHTRRACATLIHQALMSALSHTP